MKNLKWCTHNWERYGYGEWVVFDPQSECFIGRGGLRNITLNGRREIEIGYKLIPAYWGQGLATELAKMLVSVAFEALNLPDLVCYAFSNNFASIRVMEKVGFNYEANVPQSGETCVVYRLEQSQWR